MTAAALAAASTAASLLLVAGMALSRWTAYRFWPPGDRDWRWAAYFGLSTIALATLVGAGYVDWRAGAPRVASLAVGAVLVAVGAVGFAAAALDLGVRETEGLAGTLRTDGYYRYTRNPQVTFALVGLAGAPLLTGSSLVLAAAVPMACWFVLAPLAEEPWLRDRYGDAYRAYSRSVPRFVGRTTVERLYEDWRSPATDASAS